MSQTAVLDGIHGAPMVKPPQPSILYLLEGIHDAPMIKPPQPSILYLLEGIHDSPLPLNVLW